MSGEVRCRKCRQARTKIHEHDEECWERSCKLPSYNTEVELCPVHSLTERLAEAGRIYMNAATGRQSYALAEYAEAQKIFEAYDNAVTGREG